MTIRKTISLPDELAERVDRELADANVSAICRTALEKELAITKLISEGDFERIELDTEDPFTHIVRTVRFVGRWLVEPDRLATYGVDGAVWGIALTGRRRIAVWRHFDDSGAWRFGELRDYESLEEAERVTQLSDESDEFNGEAIPATILADAQAVLTGNVSILDLDI
jgi:hypothetical protein